MYRTTVRWHKRMEQSKGATMRHFPAALFSAFLAITPAMAECNTAPIVIDLAIETFDESVQVDLLAAASDTEGHPLTVSSASTTCNASITIDFDVLSMDPDPAIREDCSVSFAVEDELGETTNGILTVNVIAGVFSDSFESGNTGAWGPGE